MSINRKELQIALGLLAGQTYAKIEKELQTSPKKIAALNKALKQN
jgi:uncharacterized protein YerC